MELVFWSDSYRRRQVFLLRWPRLTSVRLSVCRVSILTVSHQGAACDAASVHFSPKISRTDILGRWMSGSADEWSLRLRVLYTMQSLALLAPTYLTTDIHLVSEYGRRPLRSSTDRTLTVPRTHNRFGDRSFAVAGPRLCNSLPISLWQISSFGQFRRYLKNHLFGIWEITAQCDAWFSALYKYSYLLTCGKGDVPRRWGALDLYSFGLWLRHARSLRISWWVRLGSDHRWIVIDRTRMWSTDTLRLSMPGAGGGRILSGVQVGTLSCDGRPRLRSDPVAVDSRVPGRDFVTLTTSGGVMERRPNVHNCSRLSRWTAALMRAWSRLMKPTAACIHGHRPFTVAYPGVHCMGQRGGRDWQVMSPNVTIRCDTVDLRALKSWRDGQLNLAHGPETKNNEKIKIKNRVAQKKRCRQKSVEAVREEEVKLRG